MTFTLNAIIGMSAACIGAILLIWSSIRATGIIRYVVEKNLAPEATRSGYRARFHFNVMSAAYVAATGKRAAVAPIYLTGVAGALMFVAGLLVAIASFNLPK